jgi:sortase A
MTNDTGGVGSPASTGNPEPGHAASHRRGRPKRKPRVTVVGVLGELLITAGVFTLLYLGWQLWLNDIIVGSEQAKEAQKLSQDWTRAEGVPTEKPAVTGTPVVSKAPGNAQRFGILYVPRWGKDWERPIAQGIGVTDVLDAIGVGHYPGTQMPGEIGNFAIAAHRKAYGGGFEKLHQLHIGDHVYIETKAGWYQYTFRDIQYVQPTEVNVLQPVPMRPGVSPTQRIITMTTCNPFYSTAERLIAYGLFDKWYPRADGPPAAIAATVKADTAKANS